MPIISGSGAAATVGGWQLLSSQTITGSPGNFDFPGVSQGYIDLLVVVQGRGSNAASTVVGSVILNADTTASHYFYFDYETSGTSLVGGFAANGAGNGMFIMTPADSAPAGHFGLAEVLIGGYANTSFLKQMQVRANTTKGTTSADIFADLVFGYWNSTAAVNRVQVQPNSGNTFKVGSTAYLYAR